MTDERLRPEDAVAAAAYGSVRDWDEVELPDGGVDAGTPKQPVKQRERAASYLSPPQFMRLNWACVPVAEAFGVKPYLVGSVLTSPDYRDIDIRLILDDDDFWRMFCGRDDGLARLRLVNIALSEMIAASSGLLNVDFQIQPQTHANTHKGMRNPIGSRSRAGGVDVPLELAKPKEDRHV